MNKVSGLFRFLALIVCSLALCVVALAGGGGTDWGFMVIGVAGSLASFFTLLWAVFEPKARASKTFSGLVGLLLLWIWVSVGQAVYLKEAWLWAGIWTATLGLGWSIHLLAREKTLSYFHGVFFVSSVLVLTISWFEWQAIPLPFENILIPNPKSTAITGPYFNAAHFGGYLVFNNAFLMGTLLLRKFDALSLLSIPLLVYSNWVLMQTDSSSIPVALLMLPLMILLWVISKNWKWGVFLSGITVLASILGVLFFNTPQGQAIFQANKQTIGLSNSWPKFIEGREAVWSYGERMWADAPWTGLGIGQFSILSASYRNDPRETQASVDRQFVNYAHSDYLQMLSEVGIIGLALFLLLNASVILLGLIKRKPAALIAAGSAVGYLITGIYDSHITFIPATMLIFYAFMGLAYAENRQVNNLMVDSGTNSRKPALTER